MISRSEQLVLSENSTFNYDHDEVLKNLYGLYDHVNLLDLNKLTLRRLYTGNGDYIFSNNTSMLDYIERISSDYIHPDDVEAYKKFSSVENIKSQLESDEKSFTMSYFRTKGRDGTYSWKAYIVVKPSFADPGIYLSCLRDVDSETEHILIKNDYVKLFNDLPLAYAVLEFNTDSDNEIICLYASNRIVELMDENLTNIVGSNVYPEFGKEHEDVVKMMRNAAFKGINSKTIYHSKRLGKWINVTVDKAAVTGRCALILEDVTKEHMTNEYMDREWRTDDLIIGCTKVLHSGLPHTVAIQQVIRLVGEASGADRIYIVEKTDADTFVGSYEWCGDNVEPALLNFIRPEEIDILDWEKEYPGAFSLVIDDVESIKYSHPDLYSKLTSYQTRSIIEMPIHEEGVHIGYFGGTNFEHINNLDLKELMEAVSYFLASEFSRIRLLRELENKSIYDSLCGVKNRSAMEMTIRKLKKRSFNIGIIYVDANGLKQMNDTKGHEAGDELLKKISNIMKRRVNRDYVYRVGGDEFVIAIPKMEKQDFLELCESLQKDFEEAEGISVAKGWDWGTTSAEIEVIMKNADKLMYEDKANYYRKNNRRRSGDR